MLVVDGVVKVDEQHVMDQWLRASDVQRVMVPMYQSRKTHLLTQDKLRPSRICPAPNAGAFL